jgi:hypothetical protein
MQVAEWIIIKYMFVPVEDYCYGSKWLLEECIGFLRLLYPMYELVDMSIFIENVML